MIEYYEKIKEASEYILGRIAQKPKMALVLGTGLGAIVENIKISDIIQYAEIPHFPTTTVEGHEGQLIAGHIGEVAVIAQSGRFHYYEGYSMKQVTLPIRVFGALQVEAIIMASAVGGVHEDYDAGDITVVNDHINLHPENPLRGPNDDRLGPRFPDMIDAYSPHLIQSAHDIANEKDIKLFDSIYAGLQGPNIETKAEYQYLYNIGATVVGMSTVPEVIVAKHMSIPTCVFTVVTNKCFPLTAIREVSIEEVLRVARNAEPKISTIVQEMIIRL